MAVRDDEFRLEHIDFWPFIEPVYNLDPVSQADRRRCNFSDPDQLIVFQAYLCLWVKISQRIPLHQ